MGSRADTSRRGDTARRRDGSSRLSVVLPWALLGALLAHLGAHVALAVVLMRRRKVGRGLLALVVPPLAPVWGWQEGLRTLVYVWAAGLIVYALGVAACAA